MDIASEIELKYDANVKRLKKKIVIFDKEYDDLNREIDEMDKKISEELNGHISFNLSIESIKTNRCEIIRCYKYVVDLSLKLVEKKKNKKTLIEIRDHLLIELEKKERSANFVSMRLGEITNLLDEFNDNYGTKLNK